MELPIIIKYQASLLIFSIELVAHNDVMPLIFKYMSIFKG